MVKSKLLIGNLNSSDYPDLSIVIPTFGRAKYLDQAINSAVKQVSTCCSYEVVVVSNDPEDSLEDIINKYSNIQNFYLYRNEENIGMVRNSNRCVELARGKYVAFLHDDDYLLDGYINLFEKYILHDDKIKCFIMGRYILFNNDDDEYRKAIKKDKLRRLYFIPDIYRKKIRKIQIKDSVKSNINCYFSPSCGTIFEKKAFKDLDGFDIKIEYSWDFDFFLRFNMKNDVYECTIPIAVYRVGANASLKSIVKVEFFDYKRTQYIQMMKNNHICDSFIEKYRNEIVASMYIQWPSEIAHALEKRGESIPKINRIKQRWFKLINMLYFYNHNLDIQRPILRR